MAALSGTTEVRTPLLTVPISSGRKDYDCGIGDDVETVLVDGKICLKDGGIPGIDLEDLLDQAQTYAERYWDNVQSWDPQGRDADEQCPPAFPANSSYRDSGLHREAIASG